MNVPNTTDDGDAKRSTIRQMLLGSGTRIEDLVRFDDGGCAREKSYLDSVGSGGASGR